MTNQLTELSQLPSQLEESERLKEMDCEQNIKREILDRNPSNRKLSRKYGVSVAFIIKCRKELDKEGL